MDVDQDAKENKKIKVTLSNPGDVFCEGRITTCPNCSEQFAEGEDILKIAKSFDKAHAEKYNEFKKNIIA